MTEKGYEIYAPETKGFIYRRVSKNKVDMPFDFRACKWRRWEVDYDAIPVWNSASAYSRGAVVRQSNNVVYLAVRTVPAGIPPMSENAYWSGALDLSGTKFIAPANYDDYDMQYNAWRLQYEVGPSYTPIGVPLTGAFRDVFTFSRYDGAAEANIDGALCANNIVRGGYNFVFYSNGTLCRNNTIGTGFISNTFGSGFSNNAIRNNCALNVVGKTCMNNEIGANFYGNFICYDMSDNRIGSNFQRNNFLSLAQCCIGNDFHNNVLGNFIYNTVGNDFSMNVLANGCSHNTIGNGFSSVSVPLDFRYNMIGNGFSNVEIGNGFQYNAVLDWREDASYLNFSGIPELHGKRYTHVIQLNGANGFTVTWYSNQLNTTMVTI
jgi:hypothetical protein